MEYEDEEPMVIQTVMMPTQELLNRVFKRGWSTTETGIPFIMMPETNKYVDPSMMFPWSVWPLRTTLIQRRDFKWEVVEHCRPYYMDLSYEKEIDECNGNRVLVLIFSTRRTQARGA